MSRQTARWEDGRAPNGGRTILLWVVTSLSAGWFVPEPSLRAQEPGQEVTTVRVTLQLRDAEGQAPLMGALVRVPGQARPYITGVDGQVSFDVPVGNWVITVRK
ncbi:MAG: hypothetical protein F4123_09965, partial [Gemmatimonadetes bacterium]|nr:hypothetical protein [Gemmatimonadota bacterium]